MKFLVFKMEQAFGLRLSFNFCVQNQQLCIIVMYIFCAALIKIILSIPTDIFELIVIFAVIPPAKLNFKPRIVPVSENQSSMEQTDIVSIQWRSQFIFADELFITSLFENKFDKSWEDAVPVWLQAKRALLNNNLSEAGPFIQKLYSLFEMDCTQINMAALQLELKNPASALRILEFSGEKPKKHWEYYFNKSLAFIDLGEYRLALMSLKKLANLEETNVKVAFCYAKIYQQLGYYYKAGEYLELTARLAPNYSPCWYLLGMTQSKLGRLPEAYSSFDQAQKIRPQQFGLWYNKGNVLLRMAKYEQALTCYRHALGLNPGYAMAWNNLGIAFTRLGRNFEALQSYRRALSFNPRLHEAVLNCGLIFETMGKLEKALEYYKRFLQIAPDDFSKQKSCIAARVDKLRQ